MGKAKISILIVVTVVLLIVGASLPDLTAAIQDSTDINHFGYSDMQSVRLDFSEERQYLPVIGKLALISNMETIDIDTSQASMTEDEVFAAAETLMEQYVDAGIFQWFDVSFRGAAPKLGVDLNDANNFLVYWTVSYSSWDGQSQSLLLDIDDETGKILCIRYGVYDSYTMDGVWERNKAIMDAFTDIYFSQLGLTEAAEYAESIEAGYEYFERDGGVSSALYSFGDAIYGEINMEFYVEGPGGFYLYFPN